MKTFLTILPLLQVVLLIYCFLSCSKEFDVGNFGNIKNAVNTLDYSNVSPTTAVVSGNVITDNEASLTARGICYGIDDNPTIQGTKKANALSTLGSFSCTLDNLSPSTKYYARAYATNSYGTAYGNSVTFTTASPTVPSNVSTNGLVGYWGFNGNANDQSGNGNDGVVNGATLTTDRFGNANSAYTFNGINNYIQTNYQGVLGSNFRTISFWAKTNSSTEMAAFSYGAASGTGNRFDGYFNYNGIGCTANIDGGAVTYSTTSQVNDNNWHNYIYIVDQINSQAINIKIYQDGILLTKVINTYNPNISISTINEIGLRFGKTTYPGIPSYFNGKIDDIGFWNRALTLNEITQFYNTALSPIEVTIGTNTWTTKNLDVATYSDGTAIPQVTDPTAWAKLTTGAWCFYNNDSAKGTTYGKLYNWYAVAGIWNETSKTDATQRKKLAPTGYHVPSDAEWTTLTDYLGGQFVAGVKMKEIGMTHWNIPNQDATNSSGFTGLPGGYRYNGVFNNIGNYGSWWSSSDASTASTWCRTLYYGNGNCSNSFDNKTSGNTVRCIKD